MVSHCTGRANHVRFTYNHKFNTVFINFHSDYMYINKSGHDRIGGNN